MLSLAQNGGEPKPHGSVRVETLRWVGLGDAEVGRNQGVRLDALLGGVDVAESEVVRDVWEREGVGDVWGLEETGGLGWKEQQEKNAQHGCGV